MPKGWPGINVYKKNILLRANLWGGPCDPYAQVYKLKNNKSSIEIEETECPDEGASAKLEFYIEGDVLALALLDKTCVELVENKETLNFFLNRYKIKNLNDENLMKAYSVFFPIKKASSDWISKAKNKNDWVPIVLSMCRSPLWQLL